MTLEQILQSAVILTCAGAWGYWVVSIEQRVRELRRGLGKLTASTQASAQRTVHVPQDWKEKFCQDILAHESKKVNVANLGPMEDADTAAAIPPFVQTIPKHNGPTTTLAE